MSMCTYEQDLFEWFLSIYPLNFESDFRIKRFNKLLLSTMRKNQCFEQRFKQIDFNDIFPNSPEIIDLIEGSENCLEPLPDLLQKLELLLMSNKGHVEIQLPKYPAHTHTHKCTFGCQNITICPFKYRNLISIADVMCQWLHVNQHDYGNPIIRCHNQLKKTQRNLAIGRES